MLQLWTAYSTPSQYQDPNTFSDWVTGTCPLLVKQPDGSFKLENTGTDGDCNYVHYCWFKVYRTQNYSPCN